MTWRLRYCKAIPLEVEGFLEYTVLPIFVNINNQY